MIKLNGKILGFLIVIFVTISCKSILEERLADGGWTVQIIRYNSRNIYKDLRDNVIVFHKDGTARFDDIKIKDLKTENWYLNKDTLVIEGNSIPFSGKYLTELQIDPETNIMTLYMKSDSTELKMTRNPNPLDRLLKH